MGTSDGEGSRSESTLRARSWRAGSHERACIRKRRLLLVRICPELSRQCRGGKARFRAATPDASNAQSVHVKRRVAPTRPTVGAR